MVEVQDYPVLRAEILRILYAAHPEWLPRIVLKRTLATRGFNVDDKFFNSEMEFLRDEPEEKYGYLEWKIIEEGTGRKEKFLFKITNRGIKLIEGTGPRNKAIAIPD